MSDNTPNREWRCYLDDMIGFCAKVEIFTHGLEEIGDYIAQDNPVRAGSFVAAMAAVAAVDKFAAQTWRPGTSSCDNAPHAQHP